MPFTIDPIFRSLIPPLSAEERDQLTANLRADGCRDPLVVWKTPEGETLLLDGHHRYDICVAEQIPFTTVEIALSSRAEAERWIIANQLGRRNLTPDQLSYLRGKRYHLEKRQGQRTDLTSAQNEQKCPTPEHLASEYGVSRTTIVRDGQFAAAVDTLVEHGGEQVRRDILSGKADLPKKDVVHLAKIAEQRPDEAQAAIEQCTRGEKIRVVVPELMDDEEPTLHPSSKAKRAALARLYELGFALKSCQAPPSVDQVQEWGETILAATQEIGTVPAWAVANFV